MSERAASAVAKFVDELRRRGMRVSPRQSVQFVDALALTSGTRVRDVAAATLATSPEDLSIIDAALGGMPSTAPRARPSHVTALVENEDGAGTDVRDGRSDPLGRGSFSTIEVLRQRDLADCSDAERAQIRELAARISLRGDERRIRRTTASRRRGSLDGRATIRAATRTDAEIIRLHRRTRRSRSRRVVLLLDVSGSMEPYARELLHLAHVGAVGAGRVEVFALGTRLTRLTRALSSHDPGTALDAALQAARDWGGGTRLGATLRALNDDPTARGLLRAATVVVLSDGLDRGDPAVLDAQLARVARVAHRLVWVNPLRASEGYEPTATGMQTALPHVDAFVDGHSLAAFEELAQFVSTPRKGH